MESDAKESGLAFTTPKRITSSTYGRPCFSTPLKDVGAVNGGFLEHAEVVVAELVGDVFDGESPTTSGDPVGEDLFDCGGDVVVVHGYQDGNLGGLAYFSGPTIPSRQGQPLGRHDLIQRRRRGCVPAVS